MPLGRQHLAHEVVERRGSTRRWPCVSLISTSIASSSDRVRFHHRLPALTRVELVHDSCRPMLGILDAAVIDADQRLDQALADLGDLAEGQAALVELAVAEPLVDQVA